MKIIEDDLFSLFDAGEFDAIGHGCNCFNTMGGGIAAQVRSRYPDAWAKDQNTISGDINKLGTFTVCDSYYDKPYFRNRLYNLYTQYDFGGGGRIYLNYDALKLCFYKLNLLEKGKKIGLPMIGCGLAGGDEITVTKLIDLYLKDCDVTLVKYKGKV